MEGGVRYKFPSPGNTEVILSDRKFTLEMIGEQLREGGTLVIVFTPLYELFEKFRPQWFVVLGVLILGIAMLVAGIEIERRRA